MITRDNVQFGNRNISYNIVYSDRRKNATLSVYPLKTVEISVPANLERERIQNLVRKKAEWVMKQILWFDEIVQTASVKEHVNGESYLYLGRQYRLKIIKNREKPQASLEGKYLAVTLPGKTPEKREKAIVKAAIWKWYREQANVTMRESIKTYSEKLGIKEPKFRIKNQEKRWGSCTEKNALNFNFRIAMAPVSLLNYVVAHEMCHINHKHHSNKFWESLRIIMPDYEERKERLRREGSQYIL